MYMTHAKTCILQTNRAYFGVIRTDIYPKSVMYSNTKIITLLCIVFARCRQVDEDGDETMALQRTRSRSTLRLPAAARASTDEASSRCRRKKHKKGKKGKKKHHKKRRH